MARPLSRCVRPGPRQCPLHRRQCLRVSSPVLLSRQREASDRDFHSSARRPAAPGVAQMRAHRPAAQAMQSIKGQIKEALGKGGAGDDIGLMEGTFIRPTGKSIPSPFTAPRDRFKLEWTWVKRRVSDIASRIIYRWRIKKHPPRPERIYPWDLQRLATSLHQQLYPALAAGDTHTLERICCTGLLLALQERIAARPAGHTHTWALVPPPPTPWSRAKRRLGFGEPRESAYVGWTPRVVAHRASPLPMPGLGECGLRQAVVRLRSRQAVDVYGGGRGVWGNKVKGTEREVTEYLVLQRRLVAGVEEDWKVWGFAGETTVEGLREMERREQLQLVAQQNRMGMFGQS